MTVAFIGIDLAKNVFQLHGASVDGQAVLKRRIRREGLLAEITELEPCIIGVEACTGAFYWQRQFEALGHTVKVIASQFVKPFVKHQKNDQNDAEAICTALMLPNMPMIATPVSGYKSHISIDRRFAYNFDRLVFHERRNAMG